MMTVLPAKYPFREIEKEKIFFDYSVLDWLSLSLSLSYLEQVLCKQQRRILPFLETTKDYFEKKESEVRDV